MEFLNILIISHYINNYFKWEFTIHYVPFMLTLSLIIYLNYKTFNDGENYLDNKFKNAKSKYKIAGIILWISYLIITVFLMKYWFRSLSPFDSN